MRMLIIPPSRYQFVEKPRRTVQRNITELFYVNSTKKLNCLNELGNLITF